MDRLFTLCLILEIDQSKSVTVKNAKCISLSRQMLHSLLTYADLKSYLWSQSQCCCVFRLSGVAQITCLFLMPGRIGFKLGTNVGSVVWVQSDNWDTIESWKYPTNEWCSIWVLLKRNKQKNVINTNIREQTGVALKVSQTKSSRAFSRKKKNVWSNNYYSNISFKKHNWTTSRNARHTRLPVLPATKTFFFLPVDSFLHLGK